MCVNKHDSQMKQESHSNSRKCVTVVYRERLASTGCCRLLSPAG